MSCNCLHLEVEARELNTVTRTPVQGFVKAETMPSEDGGHSILVFGKVVTVRKRGLKASTAEDDLSKAP